MGMKYKVPVQSLIDHIKTALDVDPWAKEMVEELLKEQPKVVQCKDCEHSKSYSNGKMFGCEFGNGLREPDWFCADGERREEE